MANLPALPGGVASGSNGLRLNRKPRHMRDGNEMLMTILLVLLILFVLMMIL